MAAIGGITLDDEGVAGHAGGGGAGYNQDEVTAMVLGRRARLNASSINPQITDVMSTGYALNEGMDGKAPFELMTYTKPVAVPSRAARMPVWFGNGFIDRVLSIAAWPNLGGKIAVPLKAGMTGVTLPRQSPGWERSRRNIVSPGNMPYGDLTAMYPHIYATGEE